MVFSILFKWISLRFLVYFALKVSESTTKCVDIGRVISSIPSLKELKGVRSHARRHLPSPPRVGRY
jgi:hypothetical protein